MGEAYRHSVFIANMRDAAQQQSREPLATFGSNHMSDWTPTEFSKRLLGHIPDNIPLQAAPRVTLVAPPPAAKDWTGIATSPVKGQGRCGSCWAFSATEQIESDFMLQKNASFVLAPQELVDCRGNGTQRNGCHGGSPHGAYSVIEELGGMELESAYPYQAKDEQCRFSKSKAKVTIAGYQAVGHGNETEMRMYLGTVGPLSVCVQAKGWHHYKHGILTGCPNVGTDHCVQLVGYGSENGTDFWKLRNSWGTRFGEDGFIRVQFGSNQCNVDCCATKTIAGQIIELDTLVV